MKISNVNKQSLWPGRKRIDSKGQKSFSSYLDLANKDHSKEQLREMLNNINQLGNKLKQQITPETILAYKDLVKEYLAYILKNYHKIKRVRSIDYSNLYTRVEVIDQEVEELTKKFFSDQKDILDLVARVDRIEGLLLDLYQ